MRRIGPIDRAAHGFQREKRRAHKLYTKLKAKQAEIDKLTGNVGVP